MELDPPENSFPAKREYRMSYNLRLLFTGLALAVLGLVWGLVRGSLADGEELAPIVARVINGITLVVILWITYIWVLHSCRRYSLSQLGIAMRGLRGRTEIDFDASTEFYHEVDSVQLPTPIGGIGIGIDGLAQSFGNLPEENFKHIHTTVWKDGKSISIDSNVKGAGELRHLLIAAEMEFVLPDLKRRLAAGERIGFGKKITLQGKTVIFGSRTAQLQDVEVALVDDSQLVLKNRRAGGRAFRSRTNRIPNVHSLIALLQQEQDPDNK